MFLLLGPALRFILSSADLRALHITVLDQRSSAHLHSLIEGNLLIVDEAVLSEVLLTLLLLLGLIVGHIGGVAPPVIGVVTQQPHHTQSPPPSPPCQYTSFHLHQVKQQLLLWRTHCHHPDDLHEQPNCC